ncbi:hypothetical protein [Cellulomonas fulva]|nr:hypothetical protein [Cellulomonas fulva]
MTRPPTDDPRTTRTDVLARTAARQDVHDPHRAGHHRPAHLTKE